MREHSIIDTEARHEPSSLSALLFPIFAAPALACLQDRDSLEVEARGVPDVMRALSGRFERNPPLFFQMRIQRVERELAASPARLDLYDDIAVASDKLGRSDEALKWIEKKRVRLQVLEAGKPDVREHWYRYWANVGTFRVHKWIHDGANRKNLREVRQARDEIARAIAIKPGAHFGREKYQIKAMNWILRPSPTSKNQRELPNLLELNEDDLPYSQKAGQEDLKKRGYSDAERGLTGLITLGAAWQSIDVFNALRSVQAWQENNSVAYLLHLRMEELARDGRASLHPKAPRGAKLLEQFDPDGEYRRMLERKLYLASMKQAELDFKMLRDEADAWHARRTDWMMARLKAGQHPDTDPTFWSGWDDGTPPSLIAPDKRTLPIKGILIVLASGAIGALVVRRRRKKATA